MSLWDVGCQPVLWHLSDSTRDTCRGLMLYDPSGTELRRTSLYGTQVVELRVDTTPDSFEKYHYCLSGRQFQR